MVYCLCFTKWHPVLVIQGRMARVGGLHRHAAVIKDRKAIGNYMEQLGAVVCTHMSLVICFYGTLAQSPILMKWAKNQLIWREVNYQANICAMLFRCRLNS